MTEDWRSQGVFFTCAREYYYSAAPETITQPRASEPAAGGVCGASGFGALVSWIEGDLLASLDRDLEDFRSAAVKAAGAREDEG